MTRPQIRASQLVTTFGPGAMVDLPTQSVIMAGLEHWRYDQNENPVISEPRLVAKLRALLERPNLDLRRPPAASDDPYREFTTFVKAFEFPEWFIVQHWVTKRGARARQLVHRERLDQGMFHDGERRRPVTPIRFVRACPRGHVGDIAWPAVLHPDKNACHRDLFVEEHGTSGDLSEIVVRCECGGELRMSIAAEAGTEALGRCDGERAWLGPFAKQSCGVPNRLLNRSASNAYFTETMSALSIPTAFGEIDEVVKANLDAFSTCLAHPAVLGTLRLVPNLKHKIERWTDDEILAAVRRCRDAAPDERPVKDAEFDALTLAQEELGADTFEGDFLARVLPKDEWSTSWTTPIRRVALVHRLREVVALVGFTRFESVGTDTQGELLPIKVERAPLSLDVPWLPAVENRGEGIFLEFDPTVVERWLDRREVAERAKLLRSAFDLWLLDHQSSTREWPGLAYTMLHTLSHLLMAAISVECGYPATSLRERVYAQPGRFGVLLYTAAPDAEGTLGGLVAAGRDLRRHLGNAIESARLCSNDPVCAYHDPCGPGGRTLLGAACHGCVLAPETSCEQRNDWLDRSLVVPTLADSSCALFGERT